jgi:hypothetical protein
MPTLELPGDAIVLASGASAVATTAALAAETRTVFIRCEGTGARVAVLMARGSQLEVAALLSAHTKGVSLNEGEGRFFGVPAGWQGKDNVRIAVIDRAAVQ